MATHIYFFIKKTAKVEQSQGLIQTVLPTKYELTVIMFVYVKRCYIWVNCTLPPSCRKNFPHWTVRLDASNYILGFFISTSVWVFFISMPCLCSSQDFSVTKWYTLNNESSEGKPLFTHGTGKQKAPHSSNNMPCLTISPQCLCYPSG